MKWIAKEDMYYIKASELWEWLWVVKWQIIEWIEWNFDWEITINLWKNWNWINRHISIDNFDKVLID